MWLCKNISTDDIYKDTVEDVETRFDTTNYKLHRLLPKGKNKKVTRLIKDELGGTVMANFIGLRVNTYSYLIDGSSVNKKTKDTNECLIKVKPIFKNYKNCTKKLKQLN